MAYYMDNTINFKDEKMKKLLAFLFILIYGCGGGDGMSSGNCYQYMTNHYDSVKLIPDKSFKYVAVKDSIVYYVEMMGKDTTETMTFKLFNFKKGQ